MIEWIWPWLLLLLPLPLLARHLLPARQQPQAALRAPFFEQWRALSEQQGGIRGNSHWSKLIMLWLVWLCLVVATARPMWIGDAIELPKSGRDLMMAVDISGSMRTKDMVAGQQAISRLIAVKAVGSEFIALRRGDRLGLILFGSQAYVQSPLSFDTDTVERFLREAQIGFAGQETAIGDAIGLAVKRLKERPAESRVLILLTDGQDTASSIQPLEAARLAASLGIRIYTIGIGADQMTVPGPFGGAFGSRQVNPAAELDESTLEEIAGRTGGRYFRARNPQELAEIYDLLNTLEPVEQEADTYRPREALSHWPLALALLFSLLIAAAHCWHSGIGRQHSTVGRLP